MAIALSGCHGRNGGTTGSDAFTEIAPRCAPAFSVGVPVLDANGCPPAPAAPDLLDTALAAGGLKRCDLFFSNLWDASLQDPFRMPWFDAAHNEPLLVPGFAQAIASSVDMAMRSQAPAAELIQLAAAALGIDRDVCLTGDSLKVSLADPAPFAHAVEALIIHAGGDADSEKIESQAASIPLDLQRALVPLIRLLTRAGDMQTDLLAPLNDDAHLAGELRLAPYAAMPGAQVPDLGQPAVFNAYAAAKVGGLASYAAEIALYVESSGLRRFRGATGFSFIAQTPYGTIAVRDAEDQVLDANSDFPGNVLLLIKTGGNDTYRIPAGATVDGAPASIAIDLGGDDQYLYDVVKSPGDGPGLLPSDAGGRCPEATCSPAGYGPISLSTTPRQGAGILGVGMLFDYGGGNDHYRSLRMSQGYGAFGVGLLYDDGGSDLFEGEAQVQGAGVFGIGILADAAGNDTYHSFTQSQGFGFVGGVGLLADADGNDAYSDDVGDPALGGHPLYPSAQLPGASNASMSQGMGFGLIQPPRMSGGLGILRDARGDDSYAASVFAQGAGYWFGTGLLLDGGGNDHYDGLWWLQGVGAHAGVGVLVDAGGNDSYGLRIPPHASMQGLGHDYGVGVLLDQGGDDHYRGAGLCLGDANDGGAGMLIDTGGSDTFEGFASGSLGATSRDVDLSLLQGRPAFGLFVKAREGDAQSDRFLIGGMPSARDGDSWTEVEDPQNPYEHGIGYDGVGTIDLTPGGGHP